MPVRNIEKLAKDLETMELEITDGHCSSHVYSQLLAVYLLQNELCLAKYLWKRIPTHIKNNCVDIRNIWMVAQKMLQRDWFGVHIALNADWNKNVADIMDALKERICERALTLAGDAYSSFDIDALAKMIGLSVEESKIIVSEKGWNIFGAVVKPHKNIKQGSFSEHEENTEDQLNKLTQFVSFLEN